MENIALKINELNYDEKVKPQVFKFMASLSMVSLEEEKRIISFLSDKGIKITKPSEQKILASGFEFVKRQVEQFEELGHLKAFQDSPLRINSKGAIDRLKFLIRKNIPFVSENGLYLPSIFDKKEFEKDFGTSYLRKNEEEDKQVEDNTFSNVIEFPQSPIFDTSNTLQTINPQRETNDKSDVNFVEQILSMPQTIGLNDDTYERYERLYDLIPRILNCDIVTDNISDNLIKLITNEVPDDKTVLYYAITYGKTISPEEDQRIKNAIDLEMQTTTILDIDLRRIA